MPNPRTRIRPAQPGCSVGFRFPGDAFVMAGTFGALVRKGTARYILSNNHVLANAHAGPVGAPILQPRPYDGGVNPRDRIAVLHCCDGPANRGLWRDVAEHVAVGRA